MLKGSVVLRRALTAGAALTIALLLPGCGNGSTAGSGTPASPVTGTSTATFTDADMMFAQMMIEHHRQAVAMADLAGTRAANADVKALAGKIKGAQQPEIDTMTGWLSTWGKAPMPNASGTTMDGMNHGPMPGAMSDADMQRLAAAKGADFDRQFLTLMITHHQGAITMANQETTDGANSDAKALAAKIVTDQQAEIATMQDLLKRL